MSEYTKQKGIFFKEVQRFNQSRKIWLIYFVLVGGLMPILYGMYQQMILNKAWGDQPTSDTNLILRFLLILGVEVAVVLLISVSKLETLINSEGIHYRYPPLLRKWKIISYEEIAEYKVRKYKPLREYGGWGYRKRKFKSGTAYNVYGNVGLQLKLKNGKKILLGTQRQGAIEYAMKKLMKKE